MTAMQNVGPNGTVLRIDPLEWFDGTITAYLDQDPEWEKAVRESGRVNLAGALTDQQQAVLLRVPLGIQLEATSGLELTKFLVALRSYVETAAAGMVKWELCEHNGTPYAKVHAVELVKNLRQQEEASPVPANQSVALYYVAYGDALIISPNENVLRRAIDRRIARSARASDVAASADRGWLGDNVALTVDGQTLQLLAELVGEVEIRDFMQRRSWSNLAILNQWRRLYPNDDPVAMHERLWHVRPICPGGGEYVWNENWQTMESTVYGHPAGPKAGPGLPDVFRELDRAAAGLTFEDNGLRARFVLQTKTPDAAARGITAVGHQGENAR
jgi:hypothetical protein